MIHRRRWALVSLALTVLALAASQAGAAGVPLRGCDIGMVRRLLCGHVTALMRRADPSPGTTKVAFAVRTRSDRGRPALGTIMAMDGGPGYASASAPFPRSVAAVLAPLLGRCDLVLFDERGTGRSDVVDLPRPAVRPGPGTDRDRRVREPARPRRALRAMSTLSTRG